MKRISLREFQLHASKYIKELPIVLTQYNKDVAKVESVNSLPTEKIVGNIREVTPNRPTKQDLKEIENIKFTPVPKPRKKK